MEPRHRPDCRRLVCVLCRRVVYLCSWCDRGQRYCSRTCGAEARERGQREAGQRYQGSRRGRWCHARRQASYRQRLREAKEIVTHQGCPAESGSGKVRACKPTRPRRPHRPPYGGVSLSFRPFSGSAATELFCFVCGAACEAWVREDFLRCRRGRRPSTRRRGDDFAGTGHGDPPSFHR